MTLIQKCLLSMAILSNLAYAQPVRPLATVRSDVEPDVYQLLPEYNTEGEVSGIRILNTTAQTEKYYPSQDLTRGVVLVREMGQDVVILRSANFDPTHGGTLSLDYIFNFLLRQRRISTVEAAPTADGMAIFASGLQVSEILVKGNRIAGQVVGIKQIQYLE